MSHQPLICIYYPHQLLPAITALLHYRHKYQLPIDAPAELYIASPIKFTNTTSATEGNLWLQLLTGFPWIRLLQLDESARLKLINSNIRVLTRAKYVKEICGQERYTEIFYAHDVTTDFSAQMFMQAYPIAQRICFGDALGLVYSYEFFTSLIYQINYQKFWSYWRANLRNLLAYWRREYLLPAKKQCLDADQAILILPCDQGGDFLGNKKLSIPSRSEVLAVIEQMRKGLVTFNHYLAELNALLDKSIDKSKYLFVLGNLTESQLTTRDDEVALYVDILQQRVPKQSAIVFKMHPGSQAELQQKLISKLSNEYQILFMPTEFSQIPVEFLLPLFIKCNVLSLSYASISLAYLYQIEVQHVLSHDLIEKYIKIEKKPWVEKSNQLYLKLIQALQNWDGKSILYAN